MSTGFFEFDKPTQYCSISVVLDTLPMNYGISKQTQFIVPSNTSIEMELSFINTVDVTMIDGNLTPTIYNSAGNTILASYMIIPSDGRVVSSTKNMASSKLSLKKIDGISSCCHEGVVRVGSKDYSYKVEERIDDLSIVEKIDYLTATNNISESEKNFTLL